MADKINYAQFVNTSRKFLENYITSKHLKSCIIGVSGGIDSTVSCALANPVCKKLGIPLIGRCLPTATNRSKENDAAMLVGQAFCDNFKLISIEDMCKSLILGLVLCEGSLTALQKGNVKARVRMIYLRNLASIHTGVVLDNDNFTEWNLGFWTIGGDSPGDINLGIHYLWKTEVGELADYLCTEYMESTVPIKHTEQSEAIKASMSLIPTDGNGVSNNDCEQFGLDNYEQVDDVLKTMYYRPGFKKGYQPMADNTVDKEYIRLIDSYNEQGVDKIMVLHQNTEYKRKPAPIMPTMENLF